MKLRTKTEVTANVITKSETPWTMDGRSGTSYRIGLLCSGDVEKVKVVSKEVYDRAELGKDYQLVFSIEVNNGSVREPRIEDLIPAGPVKDGNQK